MSEATYTPEEMMVVAAARLLDEDDVVFIGIGLPSKAANLARKTHSREAGSGPVFLELHRSIAMETSTPR